jgi:acetoin utilization deacetylase AcuC-like enzyme
MTMTITTAIIAPAICAEHHVPVGHPESPARIEAVHRALADPDFASFARLSCNPATDDDLLLVHEAQHLTQIKALAEKAVGAKMVALDSDTYLSASSLDVARTAAGSGIAAVDWVLASRSDETRRAFCAVRPPGHHAEPDRGMGFCLFNSAAIAVRHAQRRHELKRVALVDFDVHHGNGSQALALNDPTFLYASIHQSPAYPGTGKASETGSGNLFNAPLPPGASAAAWRLAFTGLIDMVNEWDPELIVISAGFDAHARDPLADLNLTEADYAWATDRLCSLGTGRVVSLLEGGYHLGALEMCVRAHLHALAG